MRIKSQGNGINISAYINTAELEKSLSAPYRERIKVLESLVKKRDYYIKSMHAQLRKRRWIAYIAYVSNKVMKPLTNISIKRIMILFYMYEREFTSITKLQADFKQLGVPYTQMLNDVNYLIKLNLVKRDGRGFYYLLDKGREIIEYYEKNTTRLFLHMAKIKQDMTQVKVTEVIPKPCKFSEAELKRRKDSYHKMMRPFWDSGYTIMPKDRGKRIDLLSKWMKDNNVKDEWYTKLIFDWGSKSK
jgi:hypothetical protein